MGDSVIFHTLEEQEIIKKIAAKEVLKGNLLRQAQSSHDKIIFEAVDDINGEIDELLKDLEITKIAKKQRAITNKKNLKR